MGKERVELGSNGIKKVLKNFTPVEAISEYIWNGFDATATKVNIEIIENMIEGIEEIRISDNGYGIKYGELENKFKPFFESNKVVQRNSEFNSSSYHGKNGIGRLTFFIFASNAEWYTTFEDDNKLYSYNIKIDSENLNDYATTEILEVEGEGEGGRETGTVVSFKNIDMNLQKKDIINYLQVEFCWFLELMKVNEFQLTINEMILTYDDILDNSEEFTYSFGETDFKVVFCKWKRKLNSEYSKYYYINSENKEIHKENTTLNNKGDNFYHSVYITSALFDEFSFEKSDGQLRLQIVGKNKEHEAFVYIKGKIDKLIREKRDPFIRKYTKVFIKQVQDKKAYPDFEEGNLLDNYKKECLDELLSTIYYVEPKIFSGLNKDQLKTMVRLFALVMESGDRENFIKILDSVVDMSKNERAELAQVLEFTTMSNITKTMEMLKDRAKAVADLKALVFNKGLGAGEINAIQPFIEKHYWLFGEQYHLVTAEEPDFEEALRRYEYILTGEKKTRNEVRMDCADRKKQMDIFAVRQMKDGEVKNSIIVELKHPNIILGYKELEQVKRYKDVILNEDRFNTEIIEWKFYLVGNKYNNQIESEIKNSRSHGEKSLVYSVDNFKIYVKSWSEIFTEFEINYDFLYKKLEIEQEKILIQKGKTKEYILNEQEYSSAKAEEELVI